MRNRFKELFRCLVVCAITSIVASCSSDQLPIGASLQITPDTRSIQIVELRDENDVCIFFENNYVDLPIILTLADSQQSPIGGADVSVYVDFAENTFTGIPALKLYIDNNGNGVIDDETEYVSGIDDPIARVRTRALSGDSALILRVNLSCSFRGEVFAFVDGVTASSSISVDATETTPTPTTTDASAYIGG